MGNIPYKFTYTGVLASGTTGAISNSLSPTISNSSEYSVLQGLYTEVRLLKCVVTFTSLVPTVLTNQSRVLVGTNMVMSNSVFTLPTSNADVQNLKWLRMFVSASVTPKKYNMYVPKDLEYANIVSDAPSPVTPYAGSPGIVQVYGTGFAVSTNIFTVDLSCWFRLRGRQ